MNEILPPHSPESEQAVLACLIIDPNTSIPTALEFFGQEFDAFYEVRHRTIYQTIISMYDASQPIDSVTLFERLKSSNLISEAGGIEYLLRLPDSIPSAQNIRPYCEVVFDRYIARLTVSACTDTVSEVYEASESADQLLDRFESRITAIRVRCTRTKLLDMSQLTAAALEYIEALSTKPGSLMGLPTGFTDLDRLTSGLQAGEMIVLAGYPGQGKTSLAINIAEFVSIGCGAPVGVFSAEMTAQSLVYRMLCSRAKVNLRSVQGGFLGQRDFPKIIDAGAKLRKAPIYIDDSSNLSILQLRARARRMWNLYRIKLIVVDYLQLFNAGQKRNNESRQDEVAAISRGLKTLSKELQIPILVLSQLNDEGKLRESRAIGQDADLVWFLDPPKEEDLERDVIPMNLRIGKNRNGPTGKIPLTFFRQHTRFESAAYDHD